jgi:hypothetical protein
LSSPPAYIAVVGTDIYCVCRRSKHQAHQAHAVLIIPDIAFQLFTKCGNVGKAIYICPVKLDS